MYSMHERIGNTIFYIVLYITYGYQVVKYTKLWHTHETEVTMRNNKFWPADDIAWQTTRKKLNRLETRDNVKVKY